MPAQATNASVRPGRFLTPSPPTPTPPPRCARGWRASRASPSPSSRTSCCRATTSCTSAVSTACACRWGPAGGGVIRVGGFGQVRTLGVGGGSGCAARARPPTHPPTKPLILAHVCLQIGGSDQWGNITAGTDLIRKLLGRDDGSQEAPSCFGLTFPLLVGRPTLLHFLCTPPHEVIPHKAVQTKRVARTNPHSRCSLPCAGGLGGPQVWQECGRGDLAERREAVPLQVLPAPVQRAGRRHRALPAHADLPAARGSRLALGFDLQCPRMLALSPRAAPPSVPAWHQHTGARNPHLRKAHPCPCPHPATLSPCRRRWLPWRLPWPCPGTCPTRRSGGWRRR